MQISQPTADKQHSFDPLASQGQEYEGVLAILDNTQQSELEAPVSFFDLSNQEITAMAQEATKAAVAGLHQRGIATYAEEDGVIYETKPNGEIVIIEDPLKNK